MANYQIELTEEAKEDVYYYDAFERKIIVSGIRDQLSDQPDVETKNRKPLRENKLAPWEVRIGKFRVFYKLDETGKTVTVVSVGHKEHNIVLIRGKEVEL
jgi:mRNA-degrading endonuclease RelE of RelBE toxin-antitoxin system